MAVLIANNAKSTLAAAIGPLDTTLTVASGTETLFPSPSGGDYFYVTLENSTGTVREIVKVTNRSSTTFTIVRAQDDTLANIFALGSVVELRINKASLTDSIGVAIASATAAAASAAAALVSQNAAAASYDSFDDRYLGAKASDPTVDNDGNALLTGALYWNTTSNYLAIYSGSSWVPYTAGDPAGTAVAMAIALG
jgi:hypothetical protein